MNDNKDIILQIEEAVMANILAAMIDGMSKADACKKYGISTRTFTRRLQKNAALAKDIVLEERSAIHDKYSAIMSTREKYMQAILEKANEMLEDPETKLEDIMAMEKRLIMYQTSIESQLAGNIQENTEEPHRTPDGAEAFLQRLTGPNLKSAKLTLEINGEKQEESSQVVEGTVVANSS